MDTICELIRLKAVNERAAIECRRGLVEKAGGRIEREPQRKTAGDLAVTAVELRFRQLPDRDGVRLEMAASRERVGYLNFAGLKVLQTGNHRVERIALPTLPDRSDRVQFRVDRFGVRLGPLLAEAEGADVVDVPAGGPALAQ